MKITDDLFSLGLALTLIFMFVIFNVYAADKSIISFYSDGKLKSCVKEGN